ncbi:MAG: hypothetical protein HZB33_07660 [Nitrospirae bacterium]|nr:hypothetical protein [Nitrospirota bacterium]
MTEPKKAKILIVDDENNLKLPGMILQSYNYDYQTAKNGFEALDHGS